MIEQSGKLLLELSDLSRMSDGDLESLHSLIRSELADRAEARRTLTLGMERSANAFEGYRNPFNLSEVWDGLGRKPRWVRILIEEGMSLGHVDKWRSQSLIQAMSMKPRTLSAVLS